MIYDNVQLYKKKNSRSRQCTFIRLQLLTKCVWCFCYHSVCWILHDLWSFDCFLLSFFTVVMIALLISDRKVRGSQAYGHLVLFLTSLCFSLLYTISYNLRPKSWLGSTLKCQIDFFYCLQGSTKYSGMFGQQRKVCSDITNEKGSQGWLVQASLDIQISE